MKDWRGIAWKDPRKKKAGESQMQMRDIIDIVSVSDPLKQLENKKARKRWKKAENCFFVINSRQARLELECNSEAERDEWYGAFHTMWTTFKTNPRKLKKA